MGQIVIEGFGVVDIEGDEPSPDEQRAIAEALAAGDQDEAVPQPQAPSNAQAQPVEGPLGVMPTGARQDVRETIERQPGILQFLAEAGPSLTGAVGGAALGGMAAGPPGALVGGILGGLGGETAAQETGVAPRSDLNLALSAGGPLLGAGVGKGFQLMRRGAGGALTKMPFARAARARNVMGKAVEEFESLGTKILSKQKGLLARPAGELYDAMRRAGGTVAGRDLDQTRRAVFELVGEMKPISPLPEVKQAMRVLQSVEKSLAGTHSIDTLVRARQLVGVAVRRAESASGIRLGGAKKVYRALSEDLDAFAKSPTLTGRAARLAKAATGRAKLEFAVKDMEQGVARFITDAADGGTKFNVAGFQKWLRGVTNAKSKQFDKNFTAALKDELPAIQETLEALAKITAEGSPAGPGSIVVRGQTARMGRAVVGGIIGGAAGGGAGAGAGALLGASAPEMIVGALTTKTGAAFLEHAAKLGRGTLNVRVWSALGNILARASGEKDEAARRKQTVRGIEGTPAETE